jgi:hypothetical protein
MNIRNVYVLCMDKCQYSVKVINVTGLNALFVPILLFLMSEFFSVNDIPVCKEQTHIQINFD